MSESPVPAPPEAFNFAAWLLQANAGRSRKAAFVDDAGSLAYGELDERARRFAAALKEAGVKREERALLLMLDSNDWPVAFLGCMLAGVAPVAVNTLMTADDYAFMLEHSRAQAAFVSGALKPALKGALTKSDHEVHKVVVSRPAQPLEFGEVEFEAFLDGSAPLARTAKTHADDPAFWLYSSGSTGRPKGTVHSYANPYWTCELYGKAVLGLAESDVCFSAAKLFFAYGLGNALTFPISVGATTLLMAERPTPEALFKRWAGGVWGVKPTVFYGAPTGYAHARLSRIAPPRGGRAAPRLLGWRGPARRDRRALQAPFWRRHRGRHRFDRDAAHLHLEPPGQGALRRDRLAGPRLRDRTEGRGRPPGERRRARRPLYPRALGGAHVLGESGEDPRDLPGRLDQERRQVYPQRRRQLYLRRAHRRHAEGERRLGEPVRGRGDARPAPGGARGGGRRRPRPGRPHQDQGVRRAEAGRTCRRGRAEKLCQGPACAVQIPARHRVRGRTAQDRDRENPALQIAGDGEGAGGSGGLSPARGCHFGSGIEPFQWVAAPFGSDPQLPRR